MTNRRGSSLTEVLVAVVLMSFGLLSAMSFSRVGHQSLSRAERIGRVFAVAQETMEDKLGLPYGDLILEGAEVGLAKDGIRVAWKIQRDDPFPDIATIEVIVQWTDREGKEKQTSFTAIKSNPVIPGEALP